MRSVSAAIDPEVLAMNSRQPLVLIPQYFGCLVFDRRTSRYLPFDHEATALLLRLARQPPTSVFADFSSEEDRAVARGFYDCFYEKGFFRLDGTLAADLLNPQIPADHLAGPLAVHLEIIGACNLTCTHCFA